MVTGWHLCKAFTRVHYVQHGKILCKAGKAYYGTFYPEDIANANSPKPHTRCQNCIDAISAQQKKIAKQAKNILINHLNAITHEQL